MWVRSLTIPICALVLVFALTLNLSLGATTISPSDMLRAFFAFNEEEFSHFVVLYQRLPRALIAVFVGALLAVCGAILQGLTRNPLASPGLLGVTSGAVLFVV